MVEDERLGVATPMVGGEPILVASIFLSYGEEVWAMWGIELKPKVPRWQRLAASTRTLIAY